jgi:Glycosyl hydrolase family 12
VPASSGVCQATGTAALLDDFADGDNRIGIDEGRLGYWYSFDDGTGTTRPAPGTPVQWTGGKARFTVSGHTKWGAGFGFDFLKKDGTSPESCGGYDACAYEGVEFDLSGAGTRVKLPQFGQAPGADHHGFPAAPGHVKFAWRDLASEGWGKGADVAPNFDCHKVDKLQFQIAASVDADFTVSNLRFWKTGGTSGGTSGDAGAGSSGAWPGGPRICGAQAKARVAGDSVIQNNVWNGGGGQCIEYSGATFSVVQAAHNLPTNGAPGSYPSIYRGCHYGLCTTGPAPKRMSDLTTVPTTWSFVAPQGSWDIAYDAWFDPTPRTDGQNTGAEIMIWLDHRGTTPFGNRVSTVQLAGSTWEVWTGRMQNMWNYVAYVRAGAPTGSAAFDMKAFFNDAVSRNCGAGPCVKPTDYLTSVQAGIEIWNGGQGFISNAFSVMW